VRAIFPSPIADSSDALFRHAAQPDWWYLQIHPENLNIGAFAPNSLAAASFAAFLPDFP
jgi:hypothetical protein